MVTQKKKTCKVVFSVKYIYDRLHYLEPHLQLVAINISNSQENSKLVIGLINY